MWCRTHPFSNKKCRLDQFSSFLFGALYSVQQYILSYGIREGCVRLIRTPRVGCVDFTNPMGCVYPLPIQGMFVHFLAQIFEELTAQDQCKEFEHTLKASNYDAKPWKQTLNFCSRVSCAPTEPFTNGIFCFFYFFLQEMWDPLRPKYLKKYKNQNIWRKKKKKKNPHP